MFRSLRIAASLLLAFPASAATWIVDPAGGGDFLEIQDVVDAAADGDTILVLDGTFGPVTIDGKGLTIEAVGSGVQIQGSVHVVNTQPAQATLLVGLEATGLAGPSQILAADAGLRVDDCAGTVTARSCAFEGGAGKQGGGSLAPGQPGGSGVAVSNSASVVLTQCTLLGGAGGDVHHPSFAPPGGDGGRAIEASDSGVFLCQVLATGGLGGEAGNDPGTGGDALHAEGSASAIRSVNGTYTGGTGGIAWDFLGSPAGDGGDAFHADSGAAVESFGDELFRGPGGLCLVSCPNGKPGKKVNQTGGGQVAFLGPYCTGSVSAGGCSASIGSSGTPSASAGSGFLLLATGVEGQKQGQFFFSTNGKALNAWGNTGGFLCVASPVRRGELLGGNGTAGACDGALSYDLNAHWAQKPQHNPGSGSLVQAQMWYRDPQSTSNQDVALSNAIEFPVCP